MLISKPIIFDDECILGYLLRLAEINGFKNIGYLLNHMGLSWKNMHAPVKGILSGKYNLEECFKSLKIPYREFHTAKVYKGFTVGIDTNLILSMYPKVCPACLKESGYCKYYWNYLPIIVCPIHNLFLVDYQHSSDERLSWYRSSLFLFDKQPREIIDVTNNNKKLFGLSHYFFCISSGDYSSKFTPLILRGLDFKSAITFINFLAHYICRLNGYYFRPISMKNDELGRCYIDAWEVFLDWPNRFYALLSQYIDNPMRVRGLSGVHKNFRDIYERINKSELSRGMMIVKAEFENYISTYWPGAINHRRIKNITIETTHLSYISLKEASSILNCRPARIKKLVHQDKINTVIFQGKVHFSRKDIVDYSRILLENWTISEASSALQLSKYQIKILIESGVIGIIQKPNYMNRDWIIDKLSCEKLLAYLISCAAKKSPDIKSITLQGLQKSGFSIDVVVKNMINGSITYVFCNNEKFPLSFKQFDGFNMA